MFGLMRPEQKCSTRTNDHYRFHRMHYCGTCKALGHQYGHRTRLLLNFDVVFLAEILSSVSNEDLSLWSSGLQAINRCMDLPEIPGELPFSLKYAAATNTLLGALKLEDHLQDAPGVKGQLAQRFYHKAFQASFKQFREWGADTQVIRNWMTEQLRREKEAPTNFRSLHKILTYYAEPSAQLTGWILRHSAQVMGNPQLQEPLFELGYHFGQLIYILDAFEDVEKDWANKQFNPLLLYFSATRTLADRQFGKARQELISIQDSVIRSLQKLPLSVTESEKYAMQIRSNLALRIYKERQVPLDFIASVQSGWQEIISTIPSLSTSLYRFHYYFTSQIIWLIPLAADYASLGEKGKVYQWLGIFIGLLVSMGVVRMEIARRKDRKAGRRMRKARRKLRRIQRYQRVKQFFTKKRPCDDCGDDCFESCCEAIFLVLLEVLCQLAFEATKNGCLYCGENMRAGKLWPWLVLSLIVLAITLLVVFVLI